MRPPAPSPPPGPPLAPAPLPTQAIEAFQGDPPTTVFLLSMRSGSVGINLTAASHVFLMEPVGRRGGAVGRGGVGRGGVGWGAL